jgi:hypothetical protein
MDQSVITKGKWSRSKRTRALFTRLGGDHQKAIGAQEVGQPRPSDRVVVDHQHGAVVDLGPVQDRGHLGRMFFVGSQDYDSRSMESARNPSA